MVGKLDTYGLFGDVREGWLADLLPIEGEPLADFPILERVEESLVAIIYGPRDLQESVEQGLRRFELSRRRQEVETSRAATLAVLLEESMPPVTLLR